LTESTTETTAASIIASPEPGTTYCAPGGYAAILAAFTFASVHGIKRRDAVGYTILARAAGASFFLYVYASLLLSRVSFGTRIG